MAMIPIKGGYVNSNAVHIVKESGLGNGSSLQMADGSRVTTWLDEDEVAEYASLVFVVPAQTGFYLLKHAGLAQEEFWTDKQEVIAWQIEGKSWPKPVTLVDGIHHDDASHPTLCPGGRVVSQDQGERWESLEEWEAEARKDWAERRAKYLATQKTPTPATT